MGYRVRQYSLDELSRIALPGSVVPALFWALPVGHWAEHDLESLWRHFTESSGICSEFGLLLVKEHSASRDESREDRTDLGSLSACLKDIVPSGALRHLPRGFDEQRERFLLLVSGSYPQPGWGVLVRIGHETSAARGVEALAKEAASRMAPEADPGLAALSQSAKDYHAWQALRREPERPAELARAREEISAGNALIKVLDELEAIIPAASPKSLAAKAQSVLDQVGRAASASSLAAHLETIRRHHRCVVSAETLQRVPANLLADEVLPRYQQMLADRSRKGEIAKSCPDQRSRNAMDALLRLDKEQVVLDDLATGPETILAAARDAFRSAAAAIREKVHTTTVAARLRQRELESTHETHEIRRRDSLATAETAFTRSLAAATAAQWTLGPSFLSIVERMSNATGSCMTLPWDPPRMIGWKLMIGRCGITLRDIREAACELDVAAPEASAAQLQMQDSPIDGSYFTDYVHFIAMSGTTLLPREITRRLLAKLLRPSQMTELLGAHGGEQPEGDRGELADRLLEAMGWRSTGETASVPLAALAAALAGERSLLSASAIRKAVESLCKDILDVFAFLLAYDDHRIWSAIDDGAPDFRPVSRRNDWREELAHLTAGSGAILIRALGPHVFPDREEECGELADAIARLASDLNPEEHHQETTRPRRDNGKLAIDLRLMLDKAAILVGELPWHLAPSISYGDSPQIIAGQAWSHAHATPRQLRVISWNRNRTNDDGTVLVWNRDGCNPVIANPTFLDRGRRTTHI